MEKDDNTFYILRAGGYNTEYDRFSQALRAVDVHIRDDQDYEIIKITEKVVARRGNP